MISSKTVGVGGGQADWRVTPVGVVSSESPDDLLARVSVSSVTAPWTCDPSSDLASEWIPLSGELMSNL